MLIFGLDGRRGKPPMLSIRLDREVSGVKWMIGFMALTLLFGASVARAEIDPKVAKVQTETAPAEPVLVKEKTTIYHSTSKGPFYYESTYELRARKLTRGIANVVLCVAEIPNQMFQEAYRSSPISGGIYGIWKGVVKGSKRLVIGTWEIVTFYYPAKNHYQPFIEPEVVFMEYIH